MDSKENLIRTAKYLSIFTVVYNIAEGIVSIYFGLTESSIALAGFGLDSFVEVFSALIVYWKISGHTEIAARERTGLRGIGILFIILALVTAAGSIYQLYTHGQPSTTTPGIVIALISLSFMFVLWKQKTRLGTLLNDKVILGDAACSLACIKLSFILLSGSFLFILIPSLWWVDSVAALGLTYFIAQEGLGYFKADSEPECCH